MLRGLVIVAILASGAGVSSALAARFTDLHDFTNAPDGYAPVGGLVRDGAGHMFGTTEFGGASRSGSVFQVDASGHERVIYSFCARPGCADGKTPLSTLIFDAQGRLYGTASEGGACCGVVFALSHGKNDKWIERVLYQFAGGNADASTPAAALLLDAKGNLYGTTRDGGPCCGAVFELSPGQRGTWTETVLHFFAGKADGANPSGGLAMDKAGNLYGATAAGGNPFDNGTVYQLSRSQGGNWVNTVLHDFPAGPNDGSIPAGTLAIDGRDTLYGGTVLGGTMNSGAIFRLSHGNNREWKETFLYSFFGGNSDGVSPEAGVIMDGSGNLYGTTEEGGGGSQGFGSGIVFKLDRNFRETVLLHFDATSLTTPVAPLLLDAAGNLYGTAAFGGANSNANCQANFEVGCGGVFRLSRGGPK